MRYLELIKKMKINTGDKIGKISVVTTLFIKNFSR